VVVRGRQSKSRYGDSWLRRDPLKAFGRAVWQAVIVIYCQLLQVLRRPVETTTQLQTLRCVALSDARGHEETHALQQSGVREATYLPLTEVKLGSRLA